MAAVTVISAVPAAQSLTLAYPLTPEPSPSSLSLFFSFSLSFHPFLQSFLLFLLLSFVGLSCKCSCWPPILVVLRSLPKSNKHSLVVYPSLSVCVHRGEPVVGSFFSSPFSSPKFYVSLYVEFYTHNGAQLWLAHALTSPVFSVSSDWLRLLQQVSCLRCVIYFFQFNFAYIPLPFPAVSSRTSLSQSLVLCHSLSVFAFFFPCVRSPVVWFGSSFLSSPRAFSPIKGKFFFPLSFRSLRLACLVLFFFHSTYTRGILRCS